MIPEAEKIRQAYREGVTLGKQEVTDSAVCIPVELFESLEFKELSFVQKLFLIDLYVLAHDCETFTIDRSHPAAHGLQDSQALDRRLRTLLECGLLTIQGRRANKAGIRGRQQRLFAFKYRVSDELNSL